METDSYNRFKNLSLLQLVDLCIMNPKNTQIREFINEHFEEKSFFKYSKSIDGISKDIDEKNKKIIVSARTCAKEIIDHIDFERVDSFGDIEDIVYDQIKIAKSFPIK